MWLKLILILIVFYWIGRTVGNLVRAVRQDTEAPRVASPDQGKEVPVRNETAQARRDPWAQEIEDARWVDL